MTVRIRLWRGPLDGQVKTMSHPDSTIQINYLPRYKKGSKKWYEQRTQFNPYAMATPNDPFPIATSMSTTALYIKTGYVHPDGSLFYEWSDSYYKRNKTSI